MRKVAVIDLGTNTFHLLIVQASDADFIVLHREKVSVRLGRGGISKGLITPDAWERALATMRRFRDTLSAEGVEEVHATGTSAMRNAQNGQELAEAMQAETGIPVTIISGEEEARLIYYGVKQALPIGKRRSLIMDIGGGSVEFIIATQDQVFWKHSFEIGAQRLLDRFHQQDPIPEASIHSMYRFLDEALPQLKEAVSQHKPEVFIGSSGTFDTLSEIFCKQTGRDCKDSNTEFPLPLDAYRLIHQQLITKDREGRMTIPGMIEMRVDMIVVASCLIDYVLRQGPGIKHLRVSAYALKEGILFNTIHNLPLPSRQLS